ncbi:MAG: NYN domain-containing protein [Verrucomicrobiota bacterium]
MSNPVLIVDGNNVIHSTPDYAALYEQKPSSAYLQLVHLLNAFKDASGTHVVAVFDGRGPTMQQTNESRSIQVIFSSGNQSADFIIERLCQKHGDAYDVRVATNDRALGDMVSGLGVLPISLSQFWVEVHGHTDRLREKWKFS